MPALSGLHHVALTVRDRDVSARWYHDVLGFEELFREDAPDRLGCVMQGEGGVVGVVQFVPGRDEPFDPHRLGLDHLAFAVPTREAMDEWAAALLAAGVQHSGVIDVGARSILNFKDPDGIALAVFWDKPA
jgi:glyoxylase I family protein